MRRFLTSVIFLLLFIKVDAGCPDFNRYMTWQRQLCGNPYIGGSVTCGQMIEDHEIRKHSTYVRRSGDGLVLTLQNGDTLIFKNGQFTRHYFRYFCKDLGYFFVSRGFYEGGDYQMINYETGKVTTIDALPFLSPDQSRFITTVADLVAGYSPNGIKIWKFTESDLILEWSFDSGNQVGFGDAVWIDSSTIALQQVTGSDYIKTPMTLTKGKKGWELRQK